MALMKLFQEFSFKKAADAVKLYSNQIRCSSDFTQQVFAEVENARNKDDMPVEIENPFTPEKPKCILCQLNIEPDFRNVRLLSQFVSSFTGKIYGRHITGLCKDKQEKVEKAIKKAQSSCLMGHYVKNPNFLADPDLYDPSKPFKVL